MLPDCWVAAQGRLRQAVGEEPFQAWLADLRPVAMEHGTVFFEGRNRMVCDRVQRLYQPLLVKEMSAEVGTKVDVKVLPKPDAAPPERLEVGPSRPLVDDSNRTAWQVLDNLLPESVRSTAGGGRNRLPGSVFLFHGGAGVGKTFLLNWWLDRYARALGKGDAGKRPMVFDAESLTKAVQRCAQERRLDGLVEELTAPRPLVLDELHRIRGRARVQRELVRVLQARADLVQPTLLASRHHPAEVHDLEPALKSWLLSGFVTSIEPPGAEARLRYLRALEGSPSRNGRQDAVEGLANRVQGSFRDLKHAWVADRRGGTALPSHYLRLMGSPRPVFEKVLARVAERLGLEEQDICGPSQRRVTSRARKLLAWLCVQEGLTRAEVGRFLGNRSRASVSYMTRQLEQDMAESEELRNEVESLL